ncbi:hypothetical protein BHE74_00029812 [Ensete ventricosum]|nr:hypothetical protein BHE74_00029812 [Ensete ventricosum]
MPRPLPLLLLLLVAVLFLSSTIRLGGAHEHDEEEDESSCEQSPDVRVDAEFRPGIVTVDGRAEDWADVDGPQLALLPALDFDEDKAYGGGPMTVKVKGFVFLTIREVESGITFWSSRAWERQNRVGTSIAQQTRKRCTTVTVPLRIIRSDTQDPARQPAWREIRTVGHAIWSERTDHLEYWQPLTICVRLTSDERYKCHPWAYPRGRKNIDHYSQTDLSFREVEPGIPLLGIDLLCRNSTSEAIPTPFRVGPGDVGLGPSLPLRSSLPPSNHVGTLA